MRLDTVEVYRDRGNQWRHRRIATNGQVIATCHEGYVRRDHAIKMAKRIYAGPYRLVVDGAEV